MTNQSMSEYVTHYDRMILDPSVRALYEDSDLYNVGDWSGRATSLTHACTALVDRHCRETHPARLGVTRVLEVGCGLGGGTTRIAAHYPGAQLLAVNVSQAQLSYARRRHPKAHYCVGDAARLPLRDGTVDRVIAVEAALHFPSRSGFLQSAHRVLRPGGCLIFTDVLFSTNAWPGGWSVPDANLNWDRDQYAGVCNDSGFEIDVFNEITSDTWDGFVTYLARHPTLKSLGEQLALVRANYLFFRLVKRDLRE
ncbi:MAG: hypothetical protein K0Q72_3941 [Armatimonadetes bacterium]|jgi:SAM-dependent methyltransferase|nr:hypothetical protein [Armatimonadota bacterium]